MTKQVMSASVDRVVTALAEHPVVAFFGAVGTGRSSMADAVVAELDRAGVTTVMIDAASVHSLEELNEPVERMLGFDSGDLGLRPVPRDARCRIVVDNAHAIYDAQWMGGFQDLWRGFLTSESALHRVAALFLGRPVFRNAFGGRGSPLLNVGNEIWAEPLSVADLTALTGSDSSVARAVIGKTGGHPRLSLSLATHALQTSDFRDAFRQFCQNEEAYIADLIDDHGIEGKRVLAELVDMPSVREDDLLANFVDATEGLYALRDLRSSGLTREASKGLVTLSASMLREYDRIKSHIRATGLPATIPTHAPDSHGEAAASLYLVENSLRAKIMSWLDEHDPRWWPQRIPDRLRDAERLWLGERSSRFPPATRLHPIMYLTMGELLLIPEASNNWPDVFQSRWRIELSAFQAIRDDLLAIRNKVSHNRPVSGDELVVLRNAASRLRLEA